MIAFRFSAERLMLEMTEFVESKASAYVYIVRKCINTAACLRIRCYIPAPSIQHATPRAR